MVFLDDNSWILICHEGLFVADFAHLRSSLIFLNFWLCLTLSRLATQLERHRCNCLTLNDTAAIWKMTHILGLILNWFNNSMIFALWHDCRGNIICGVSFVRFFVNFVYWETKFGLLGSILMTSLFFFWRIFTFFAFTFFISRRTLTFLYGSLYTLITFLHCGVFNLIFVWLVRFWLGWDFQMMFVALL